MRTLAYSLLLLVSCDAWGDDYRTVEVELPECVFSDSCETVGKVMAARAIDDLYYRVDCGRKHQLGSEIVDLCDWKHKSLGEQYLLASKLVSELFAEPDKDGSKKRTLLHWCLSSQSLGGGFVEGSDTPRTGAEHCLAHLEEVFPKLLAQPGWALTEDAKLARWRNVNTNRREGLSNRCECS